MVPATITVERPGSTLKYDHVRLTTGQLRDTVTYEYLSRRGSARLSGPFLCVCFTVRRISVLFDAASSASRGFRNESDDVFGITRRSGKRRVIIVSQRINFLEPLSPELLGAPFGFDARRWVLISDFAFNGIDGVVDSGETGLLVVGSLKCCKLLVCLDATLGVFSGFES